MQRLNQLFRKIDDLLFEKINVLKETPQFQTFSSALDTLTDSQRKMIFQGIAYIVILLPLLPASYFFFSNSNLREELETKQQITRLIYSYKDKSSTSSSIQKSTLSSSMLKTKDDLLAIVRQVPGMPSSIEIEDFSHKKISDTFSTTKGTLTFEGLTTKTFTLLVEKLALGHKFKMAHIDIKKDTKLKTLKGKFGLIHHGSRN